MFKFKIQSKILLLEAMFVTALSLFLVIPAKAGIQKCQDKTGFLIRSVVSLFSVGNDKVMQ